MKKSITAALLTAFALTANAAELVKPVLDTPLRDVHVLHAPDGAYYLTGTLSKDDAGEDFRSNAGVGLWKSSDLQSWEDLGLVFELSDGGLGYSQLGFLRTHRAIPGQADSQRLHHGVTAPEIHYANEAYWIAASQNGYGTFLLKSKTGKPEGPYAFHAVITALGDDPSLFVDDDLPAPDGTGGQAGGQAYWLWSPAWIAPLKADFSGLAGPPQMLTCKPRGKMGDDILLGDRAPFLFKHDQRYYLTMGSTARERLGIITYDTVVGASDSLFGPYSEREILVPHSGQEVDLATGPLWRAIRSAGHRETTEKMSFAIGLPEILDARELPADWAEAEFDDSTWPAAVLLRNQAHWGELLPRSIPMLDESRVGVAECLGLWAVSGGDESAKNPFEGSREFAQVEKLADELALPRALPAVSAEAVSILVKFAPGEVLGRPVIDLTAPAGTVVDLLYTERLDEAGRPIHGYQNTRMAERCICRGGRQQWQTMHPRGFVYLEIVIRGEFEQITLHDIRLTKAAYPVARIGEFNCSEPVFEQIWRLCRDTQQVCMEDAFLDCPWRERGLYTGDMLVQYRSCLALFGDHQLMRRCVRLFFQTQDESGLLGCCSHALKPPRHPDYAAIAAISLYEYWARSGDLDFLAEMKPSLVKLMRGLKNLQVADSHLADATDLSPYIDLAYFDRDGISCAFNCYVAEAFRCAGEIMELLGEGAAAAEYRAEREAIAAAVRDGFWDEQEQLFVDRLRSDVPDTEPSIHANCLPVLYGIADESQTAKALAFITARMADNFRVPDPQENRDCNVTSYFSFYPLQVLCRHGRSREAEAFIRRYWGRYLELGAVNTWEYFVDRCSRCHAWSTSPLHFFAHEVLGIRFPEPGNPDKIAISPADTSLTRARGVYPHPRGPIRISWEKKNGAIDLDYEVPPGIEVVA